MSMFLFVFGLSMMGLMFAPVISQALISPEPYHPQLPLSPNREEGFFDITKDQGKRLYPALSETLEASDGNWIRIPSIDVTVPIALSPSMQDDDVLNTLDQGAALYPNGVQPGRLGNTFISAHSTGEPWKGTYRFAFLRINELEPGNIMHIDYAGTRYTYTITGTDIIKPTPDFQVVSNRPVPTLTLMACWPLWSTDKRMLVKGELTNITKLTPHPV
jgi:LPXTG-site transpeptidase (sortase) family protein